MMKPRELRNSDSLTKLQFIAALQKTVSVNCLDLCHEVYTLPILKVLLNA
jgi:hypothetical protein